MIVLDASAGVAVLLNLGAGAQRIRERMDLAGDDLHAPHLLEIEVANVLRRYVLSGSFSLARARLALDRLSTLKISLYAHTAMLPRIWDLRDHVSAYDAAYVALAETLCAPLVTIDTRLAPAPGIRATVEVYG